MLDYLIKTHLPVFVYSKCLPIQCTFLDFLLYLQHDLLKSPGRPVHFHWLWAVYSQYLYFVHILFAYNITIM